MAALFISDLHLHPSRPAVSRCFLDFIAALNNDQTLYILGDLFEFWVGDDHPEPAYAPVKLALQRCTADGTAVYLMHGNRDFLIGEQFAAETGCTLLDDPAVIDLCGRRTLLMHGDSLCTDDGDYQAMRTRLRSPEWQRQALSLPLGERLQLAREAREQSTLSGRGKDEYLMDVNQEAVVGALDQHCAEVLIHGHTHRPGIHHFMHNGGQRQRVVLGDWYDQGSVLRVSGDRLQLDSLPV